MLLNKTLFAPPHTSQTLNLNKHVALFVESVCQSRYHKVEYKEYHHLYLLVHYSKQEDSLPLLCAAIPVNVMQC